MAAVSPKQSARDVLDASLSACARQIIRRRLLGRLAACAGMAMIFALLLVIADHTAPAGLPRALALTASTAGLAIFAVAIVGCVLAAFLRRLNPLFAARALEHALGGTHNSLINALLVRIGRLAPALVEATTRQAARDVVNTPDVRLPVRAGERRPWGIVLAAAVAWLAYWMLAPKSVPQSVERLLGADLPAPTIVQITLLQPDSRTIVHAGQSLPIVVAVRGGTVREVTFDISASAVADTPAATRFLMSPAGDGADGAHWQLTLAPHEVARDLYFVCRAGDGRLEGVIPVHPQPEILGYEISLTPPAHSGESPSRVSDPDITIWPETDAAFTIRANTEIAAPLFVLVDESEARTRMTVGPADPRSATLATRLLRSGKYSIEFTDVYGMRLAHPRWHTITVRQPPPPENRRDEQVSNEAGEAGDRSGASGGRGDGQEGKVRGDGKDGRDRTERAASGERGGTQTAERGQQAGDRGDQGQLEAGGGDSESQDASAGGENSGGQGVSDRGDGKSGSPDNPSAGPSAEDQRFAAEHGDELRQIGQRLAQRSGPERNGAGEAESRRTDAAGQENEQAQSGDGRDGEGQAKEVAGDAGKDVGKQGPGSPSDRGQSSGQNDGQRDGSGQKSAGSGSSDETAGQSGKPADGKPKDSGSEPPSGKDQSDQSGDSGKAGKGDRGASKSAEGQQQNGGAGANQNETQNQAGDQGGEAKNAGGQGGGGRDRTDQPRGDTTPQEGQEPPVRADGESSEPDRGPDLDSRGRNEPIDVLEMLKREGRVPPELLEELNWPPQKVAAFTRALERLVNTQREQGDGGAPDRVLFQPELGERSVQEGRGLGDDVSTRADQNRNRDDKIRQIAPPPDQRVSPELRRLLDAYYRSMAEQGRQTEQASRGER